MSDNSRSPATDDASNADPLNNPLDPLGLNKAVMELTSNLMRNPDKLMQAQVNSWNSYMNLWTGSLNRWMGGETKPVTRPEKHDRRFRHEAWEINPYFDFIKQSYLITANTILESLEIAEELDHKTARKLEFYTRQYVNAMSPSNFAHTNPEVIEAALESRGDNLFNGLKNFIRDFDHKTGRLHISMTDKKAFELGENVATTPGKIVFQNELMQLIQYEPSTAEVNKTPLLIIPPWINKYYVLDMQPKNSFIKWCVDQGHTVFVISWVNPDASLRDMDFQDYMFKGVLAAMEAIEQGTGEKQVNAIGYCIGGTLLSATLAYLTAKKINRIRSATFFVTMIDFSEPGDLGVFVDEEQLTNLEKQMNELGYHDGKKMAMSFNMLRSNDLIWSFYVNNYLLGKEPFPFDLLYWNSDSTRMPAKMHSTYLRKMYLENVFKD
ncbi:MAG TPA: alpha/beta fold hydrolase, partial [Gammaproteobacteria bacterium]|nr:alpha/beta fold hydrolase [Gammaproteobacteria bacterium]